MEYVLQKLDTKSLALPSHFSWFKSWLKSLETYRNLSIKNSLTTRYDRYHSRFC